MLVDELAIRQGTNQDQQTLVDLLESHQMLSDIDPCEFYVAALSGRLVGAVRTETEEKEVYLRPLVVDHDHHGKGIGKALVNHLVSQNLNLHVVARGSAIGFYQRIGFELMPWELVPDRYRQECDLCPDIDSCQPSPMKYAGASEKST
jgi:N-acetylglutamate synthase-like GNAT family acetyltransferase